MQAPTIQILCLNNSSASRCHPQSWRVRLGPQVQSYPRNFPVRWKHPHTPQNKARANRQPPSSRRNTRNTPPLALWPTKSHTQSMATFTSTNPAGEDLKEADYTEVAPQGCDQVPRRKDPSTSSYKMSSSFAEDLAPQVSLLGTT